MTENIVVFVLKTGLMIIGEEIKSLSSNTSRKLKNCLQVMSFPVPHPSGSIDFKPAMTPIGIPINSKPIDITMNIYDVLLIIDDISVGYIDGYKKHIKIFTGESIIVEPPSKKIKG